MKNMDFNSIPSLEQYGFEGFVPFNELLSSVQPPKLNGVYMVLRTNREKVSFLEEGSGGYFKDKDPNVSIHKLIENWVDNTLVLYIGKAKARARVRKSNNLRVRLSAYKRFGEGKNVGHYGGRYIWQIKNAMSDLVVCWKATNEGDEDKTKSDLICSFREQYGKRPFANLKK